MLIYKLTSANKQRTHQAVYNYKLVNLLSPTNDKIKMNLQ